MPPSRLASSLYPLATRSLQLFLLLFTFHCSLFTPLNATTTQGPTPRNISLDGIVQSGAAPGTNGPAWETDEEFQGFSGAVNWYVTWDDNNLYLGRIGGNNAEGSVLYIRADYPASTTANTAFDYDSLSPDVTPMGGVNFAIYLKDTYHEFRTYSGVWSAANAMTLAPMFTTQGSDDHMEVSIPWNAITAGNGRPTNVRLVLYQVALPGGCATHLVYGESPWGTGNPGDGPSIGVNDGTPISPRQPGGCDVGDSTATRWWGCYPVIGGVGSNGWAAITPDAGPDDSICQTATSHFLQGNTPPGQAIGTWSVVSQPGGSPPVAFTNPNQPNTFAQNLTGFGTYTFVWDINYGGCPSLPDTVIISRFPSPDPATAMPDTVVGCNADSVLLHALGPVNGISYWTTTSPGITFVDSTDSVTMAYGLSPGTNVFTYTVTNGVCTPSTDQVVVYMPIDVTADAGPNQDLCFVSIANLAANDPTAIQTSATGLWAQVSGPNAAIFSNVALYSSNVSALVPGTYVFLWTVSNADCPTASDTVRLTNYGQPIADAGGDQVFCLGVPSITLNGNSISGLGGGAYAYWTQLAGPTQAVFADTTDPATTVTNLGGGSYFFSWLVGNGPCPEDSDVVEVRILDVQDGGVIDTIRPDSGQYNGSIIVATPNGGVAPYLYSLDGLNFVTSNVFDSLGAGTYTVYVMDFYGCNDSFTVVLPYIPPTDTVPLPDTLRVPTGFSPNGDGTNDRWEIPGIASYPNALVEVYNSWGGLVFRSVGVYEPWNGQRNGTDLPSANYYFVLDPKTPGQAIQKGSVTILR